MTFTELASYVLLLSLPLWLLIEQLIHLRTGYRKERPTPAARAGQKAPAPSLSEALRSSQK
jgi:ABC-type nickel/cobalt efflux system permease component RcnA